MRCKDIRAKNEKLGGLHGKILNLQGKIAEIMNRDGYSNDGERNMFYGMVGKVSEYQTILGGV